MLEIIDTDNAKGGVLDLSSVFTGQLASAYRKILLVDDDYLSVSDSLTALADVPAQVEWRMVTDASASVTGDGILLKQGDRSMLLCASSDTPSITPEYKIWPAAGMEEWDVPNPGKCIVGYSLTLPAEASCTVTVTLKP